MSTESSASLYPLLAVHVYLHTPVVVCLFYILKGSYSSICNCVPYSCRLPHLPLSCGWACVMLRVWLLRSVRSRELSRTFTPSFNHFTVGLWVVWERERGRKKGRRGRRRREADNEETAPPEPGADLAR